MPVELGSAYGKIEIGTEGAESNIKSLKNALDDTGKNLTLGVTAPLLAVGAMALKSAGDFEQTMNVMGQVSGATADQMAAMQAQALELGAVTSFSAGEAAEAQYELAKAGLSVQEVMDATPGVMDLAAAGGMGLAQAAEVAANAMNSFNLEASDVPDIANLLAAAANASSVDVSDLAMSMKMAGSVFASNGQSIEDMTIALAMLGNAGLKGSDAGTSLKTMMISLSAPTDKARGAIEELGLNIYDSQGQMRDFGTIMKELSVVSATLSDKQRNAAFSTIFGTDAIRAANIITRDYSTSWDELGGKLSQEGAAADVANARMKGLAGAIEYAKGSIDSFLIGAALPFLDGMSGIIKMAADALSAIGALPEPTRNMAIAFAVAAAAIGPLMLGLSGLMTVVGVLLSPIGAVAAAVALLGIAWYTNFGGIQQITQQAIDAVTPVLQGLYDLIVLQSEPMGDWSYWWEQMAAVLGEPIATAIHDIAGAMVDMKFALTNLIATLVDAGPASSEVWEALRLFPEPIRNIISNALALWVSWTAMWPSIQASLKTAWDAILATFTTMTTWLITSIPEAMTTLQSGWETAWPLIGTALSTAWAGIQTVLQSLSGALKALPTTVSGVTTQFQSFMATVGVIGGMLQAFFAPAMERLSLAFQGLPAALTPLLPALQELMGAFGGLVQSLIPLVALIGGALAIAANLGINALAAVMGNLPALIGPIIAQVTDAINTISTTITEVTNIVKAIIAGDWAAAMESAKTIFSTNTMFIRNTLVRLKDFFGAVMSTIYDTVVNTLDDMGIDIKPILDSVKKTFEDIWNKIAETMAPITGAIATIMDKLEEFKSFLQGLNLPNPFAALEAAGNAVNGLLNGMGGGGGKTDGTAIGSSYFPGGYTRIHERGDEGIILPAGSRVLTNGQTNNRNLGQEPTTRNVTINMPGMVIQGDMDIKKLRWQLANELAGI